MIKTPAEWRRRYEGVDAMKADDALALARWAADNATGAITADNLLTAYGLVTRKDSIPGGGWMVTVRTHPEGTYTLPVVAWIVDAASEVAFPLIVTDSYAEAVEDDPVVVWHPRQHTEAQAIEAITEGVTR